MSFMVLIANIVEQLLFLKQAMYFLCILSLKHNKVGMVITINTDKKTEVKRFSPDHQRGGIVWW